MSDIFETLKDVSARSVGKIYLADAIKIHAQQSFVETVRLNGQHFDCGSIYGFMQGYHYEYEKSLVI